MKKERKAQNFVYKPYYPGGIDAMKAFISTNLIYPEEAKKEKINGTVKLRYSIDYTGTVVEAKIIKSLGHGCDQEAIRLVKLLKFKVRKSRKVKVLFHKTINIHFRYEEVKKPKSTNKPSVRYNIVYQDRSSETENAYSYTITVPNRNT